jgi:hypothetical protein
MRIDVSQYRPINICLYWRIYVCMYMYVSAWIYVSGYKNLISENFFLGNRLTLIQAGNRILAGQMVIKKGRGENFMLDAMSDEWCSPFSLSEPLVERRAFERRAKRKIKKMNAWASAIQEKKLSGEWIANLEKMSECPALVFGLVILFKRYWAYP